MVLEWKKAWWATFNLCPLQTSSHMLAHLPYAPLSPIHPKSRVLRVAQKATSRRGLPTFLGTESNFQKEIWPTGNVQTRNETTNAKMYLSVLLVRYEPCSVSQTKNCCGYNKDRYEVMGMPRKSDGHSFGPQQRNDSAVLRHKLNTKPAKEFRVQLKITHIIIDNCFSPNKQ